MYTERGEDRGRDRDVERDTYGCVYVYGTAGWRNIHIAWTQEALLSYTVFTTLSLLHCLVHILQCLYYTVLHTRRGRRGPGWTFATSARSARGML
jgi:hypothetical protein